MTRKCAPMCETCDQVRLQTRCPPVDLQASKVWGSGSLDTMFINITTHSDYQKYNPQILSRPAKVENDADHKIGPWVVVLDNFITDEECNRLIELGAMEGYKRSNGVGQEKVDGTFENLVNEARTSKNAWCQNKCYEDPIAKRVMYRIANITGIPEENSEFLQLLQYNVGEFYKTHHDFIDYLQTRPQGVRLLTVFLYLNDVDAGGGTNFPLLNITCMPKMGRALIWPSVLNDNPNAIDEQTSHQALAVEMGIKYAANAWLHQRDYKEPFRDDCQ